MPISAITNAIAAAPDGTPDYARLRDMAMPPFRPPAICRAVCTLAQESWHDWSATAGQQVDNDRVQLVHVFKEKSPAEIAKALRAVLAAHDALRMPFLERHGALADIRLDPARLDIPVDDCTGLVAEEVHARVQDFAAQPVPLEGGWPLRARLFAYAEGVVCAVSFHHLVIDRHASGIVRSDLIRAAEGQVPAPESVSFAQYATHQRDWYESDKGLLLAQSWLDWRDGLEPLKSPNGKVVLEWIPGACASVTYTIDGSVQPRVRRLARQIGASPFLVYLGAYALALSRWSGASRFPIRVNSSLRTTTNLWRLVGNMITADSLACDVSAMQDFRHLAQGLGESYRRAVALRVPNLFNLAAHPQRESFRHMRLGGAAAATINFFSHPARSVAEAAESDPGILAWPPPVTASASEEWKIPLWPIYLRVTDGDGETTCKFEFNARLLTIQERDELANCFFRELGALVAC
jgi:hypothetical protein